MFASIVFVLLQVILVPTEPQHFQGYPSRPRPPHYGSDYGPYPIQTQRPIYTSPSVSYPPLQLSNDNGPLDECRFRVSDFTEAESRENYCKVQNAIVVREKRFRSQPIWCFGIYQDPGSSGSDFIDIRLSTGYQVVYSPKTQVEKINDFTTRFYFLPGQVITIVYTEHANGFPAITSIEYNGRSVCKGNNGDFSYPSETQEPTTTGNRDEFPVSMGPPQSTSPSTTSKRTTTRPTISSGEDQQASCGIRRVQLNQLIHHGSESQAGKWPWHAAIYHITSSSLHYKCGGTIVSQKAILTAAHCASEEGRPIIPERISVHLGKFILQKFSAHTREYEVFTVQIHHQFDTSSLQHDLAILKLATVIEFSDHIQPICLPSAGNYQFTNKLGTVVGWGRNQHGELATKLAEVSLKVASPLECLESNRDFFGHYLYEQSFCAGFRNGSTVCTGDSGGGLYFQREDGQSWMLGGVVSIGVRREDQVSRCDSSQYSLFTDVQKHFSWIKTFL